MNTMNRLRQSFRSSTRRKKREPEDSGGKEYLRLSLEEIEVEISSRESKFRPCDLRVRFLAPDAALERVSDAPSPWEPSLKCPLRGVSVWVPPEVIQCPLKPEIVDGYFILVDFRKKKRKSLAKIRVSLPEISRDPPLSLKLRPLSRKVSSVVLNLGVERVLLGDDGEDFLLCPSSHVKSPGKTPLESLSLGEDDISANFSPKSTEVNSTDEDFPSIPLTEEDKTPRNSLENIPDIREPTPPPRSPKKPILIFDDEPDLNEEDRSDLVVIPNELINAPHTPQQSSSPRKTGRPIALEVAEDDHLLTWAKSSLASSERIKITNLTSSWRNGMGYCCLIHNKFPDLIPLSSLENHNQDTNLRLASEAAGFLGGSVSSPLKNSSKDAVVRFLKELKHILSYEKVLTPDEIKKWRKDHPTLYNQGEDEAESPSSSIVLEQQESSPEKSIENGDQTKEEELSLRAKKLIREAHSSFEVPLRNKSPSANASLSPTIRHSVILLNKELCSLSEEEERIAKEKNDLEKQMRKDIETSPSAIDDEKLQRWISLVNEKNSLVRRQMQLNIKEKESLINARLENIKKRLHELEEVSDSLKTEQMRNEENSLLEQLVETVNEKNELVHHLDNQEKAIDDDEVIKTRLEQTSVNNITTLKSIKPGAEECVIQ